MPACSDCSNAVLPLNSIYCITAGTVVHADGLVRGNARDAFGACGLQRPSGLAGHCAPMQRDGNNRHLCKCPRGSYSQYVDGGVRKLQLCNSPGAARPDVSSRMPSVFAGLGRLLRQREPSALGVSAEPSVRGCRRSMGGRACGSRQPAGCRKPSPEPSASTQECPRRRTSPAGRWQRTHCLH